jgi:hypothetical protein
LNSAKRTSGVVIFVQAMVFWLLNSLQAGPAVPDHPVFGPRGFHGLAVEQLPATCERGQIT